MTRKKSRNPPMLSHEFVIQNHADILACIAIVIVLGLVSDATANMTKLFIFLQYSQNSNETELDAEENPLEFERGVLDVFTIFFADLLIVVIHAAIQEYGIDKVSKKLHLSKTKSSKFSESGQVLVWCAVSAGWGARLIYKLKFVPNLKLLWEGYPHTLLQWETKLFLLSQMAYWIHMFPELYFQKARKEEVASRVRYYALHLSFFVGAYILHFWRIAILLFTLHYLAEAVFHACRLFYYANKTNYSRIGFFVWKVLYPVVRFFVLSLSLLTFWFGLGKAEHQGVNFATGNYNSFFIRLVCLTSLGGVQAWLMWNFIRQQLKKSREEEQMKLKEKATVAVKESVKTKSSKKSHKKDVDEVGNGTSIRSGNKLKKN